MKSSKKFLILIIVSLFCSFAGHTASTGAGVGATSEDSQLGRLSSPGLFENIDLNQIPTVVHNIRSTFGDDNPITSILSLLENPFPVKEIRDNLFTILKRLNTYEKLGSRTEKYFTNDKIRLIINSIPNDGLLSDHIIEILSTEIDHSPLNDEEKAGLRANVLNNVNVINMIRDACPKNKFGDLLDNKIMYIQNQLAYCLVSQIALGNQAYLLQTAGSYDWMHSQILLNKETIAASRNILWKIFIESGFVTSSIRPESIADFTYNPAKVLKEYLDVHPEETTLILGCGNLSKTYSFLHNLHPYKISTFIGSQSYHSPHHHEITVGLDYRDRPTIFANLKDPELYSHIPAGRFDKIILETGESSVRDELTRIIESKLKTGGVFEIQALEN